MFVEHAELFRCPATHEETWLVAAAHRAVGRRIVDGVLGCPVCRAEYPVVGGVAYFGVAAEPGDASGSSRERAAPDEALVLRAAALLALGEPGGVAVLHGTWAPAGAALIELARVQLVLVNPAPGPDVPDEGVSVVRTRSRLPLGGGALRAAALDDTATAELLASAVHVVRAGGRLVAPARLAVPAECRELARDERHWVAERGAMASAPVPLRIVKR